MDSPFRCPRKKKKGKWRRAKKMETGRAGVPFERGGGGHREGPKTYFRVVLVGGGKTRPSEKKKPSGEKKIALTWTGLFCWGGKREPSAGGKTIRLRNRGREKDPVRNLSQKKKKGKGGVLTPAPAVWKEKKTDRPACPVTAKGGKKKNVNCPIIDGEKGVRASVLVFKEERERGKPENPPAIATRGKKLTTPPRHAAGRGEKGGGKPSPTSPRWKGHGTERMKRKKRGDGAREKKNPTQRLICREKKKGKLASVR